MKKMFLSVVGHSSLAGRTVYSIVTTQHEQADVSDMLMYLNTTYEWQYDLVVDYIRDSPFAAAADNPRYVYSVTDRYAPRSGVDDETNVLHFDSLNGTIRSTSLSMGSAGYRPLPPIALIHELSATLMSVTVSTYEVNPGLYVSK